MALYRLDSCDVKPPYTFKCYTNIIFFKYFAHKVTYFVFSKTAVVGNKQPNLHRQNYTFIRFLSLFIASRIILKKVQFPKHLKNLKKLIGDVN